MTTTQAMAAATLISPRIAWDGRQESAPLRMSARHAQRRLLTDPIVAELALRESTIRIETSQPAPSWLFAILDRLQHLVTLDKGWDSYDGVPPSDISVLKVLDVMSYVLDSTSAAPPLIPTSDGGIQIEWHVGGNELEVLVGPEGKLSAVVLDEQSGWDEEISLEITDVSRYLELIRAR